MVSYTEIPNRRLDNTEVFDIIVATYGSDSAKQH